MADRQWHIAADTASCQQAEGGVSLAPTLKLAVGSTRSGLAFGILAGRLSIHLK